MTIIVMVIIIVITTMTMVTMIINISMILTMMATMTTIATVTTMTTMATMTTIMVMTTVLQFICSFFPTKKNELSTNDCQRKYSLLRVYPSKKKTTTTMKTYEKELFLHHLSTFRVPELTQKTTITTFFESNPHTRKVEFVKNLNVRIVIIVRPSIVVIIVIVVM